MANAKFVKTAAAVALGASVVTTAVAPGAASAATKYKVNSKGNLVLKSTGSLVKGWVEFGGKLYKNGKPAPAKKYKIMGTGASMKLYFGPALKKGYKTANSKSLLFKDGKLLKGNKQTADRTRYYENGKLATGWDVVAADETKYIYKSGKLFKEPKTATRDGVLNYFENGKLAEGTKAFKDTLFTDGTVDEKDQVFEDVLYVGGKKAEGTVTFEDVVYIDGVKDTEKPEITAEDKTVEYGSEAVDVATLATVKDNSGEEIKAEAKISFDGKAVEKIDTKTPGVYTVTFTAKDKNGNEATKEVKVTVAEAAKAEVESVKAINATEVLVTTNRTLSKESAEKVANYEVFLDGANTTDIIKSAKLQEDGKSVLVRFTTPAVVNESIKVATKASLLTSNYEKFAAFTSDVKLFSDSTAPTLKSVEYNGTNVVATFSEPVTSTGNIRVDGATVTLGSPVEDVAGNYQYVLTSAPTTAGTHDVVISQIKDSNNNETGTQKGSYTIVENAAAPAVSKVEALTSNSFKVTFDKAIAGTAATDAISNLVVKKGSNTLASSRVTGVLATDKKSITYTVSTSSTDEVKLYGDNETTANLTVSFDGYKDANGLLGAAYSGNVTLSKDAKAPALLSKNLVSVDSANKVVTLTFDEAVDAVAAKNADIVIKKDGIVQSATAIAKPAVADVSSDTTERTVTLTFTTALADGDYELVLPKGLVKDKELNDSVSDSVSFKVSSAVSYFVPTVTAPTASGTSNVITVTTTNDFTDSAKDLANYTLDDTALPAGTTIDFVDDKKKVEIKLPDSFKVTSNASYKLGISSKVKDSTGASVAANATTGGVFTQQVALVDNVAPTLVSAKLVADSTDATKFNTITLTLSEALQAVGTVDQLKDFVVTVNGSEVPVNSVTLNSTNSKKVDLVIGDGSTLYAITQPTVVKVAPISTTNTVVDVKDIQGNALTTGTSVTATK